MADPGCDLDGKTEKEKIRETGQKHPNNGMERSSVLMTRMEMGLENSHRDNSSLKGREDRERA